MVTSVVVMDIAVQVAVTSTYRNNSQIKIFL